MKMNKLQIVINVVLVADLGLLSDFCNGSDAHGVHSVQEVYSQSVVAVLCGDGHVVVIHEGNATDEDHALAFHTFFDEYGKREIYFQTCYDHFNVGQGWSARYFYGKYKGEANIPEA